MKKFQCKYCLHNFSDNAHLRRHNNITQSCISREQMENIFTEKERIEKEYDELFEEFEEETKRLNKENDTLKTQISIKGNNNNANNTNSNNSVTIQINAFGSENLDNIDIKKLLKSSGLNLETKIMKEIWFNDKYPENKNVHVSNMRANTAKVYDGTRYIEQPINSVTNSMREKTTDQLYDVSDDPDKMKKLTRSQKKSIENACDVIESDDPLSERNRENKNHLKCMMYNARPINS